MFSGLCALVGRVMLAPIFIVSGAAKLADISGTGNYMASVGLQSGLALPAAIFEIVGGLMIMFGVFTRLASLAFAVFCLLTALLFHRETADPVEAAAAMKNIAIAGGFLCLIAYEGRSWSFDAYRERRRRIAAERVTIPTESAQQVIVQKRRWRF
ncbi:MAG TPA: DoxX family protein [Sphingorhabdus sp.]|jgi:putative oxidoreductase|nr:DoxX family protein [Sphingorhabdus sp.]